MNEQELLEYAAKAAGMWKDCFTLDDDFMPEFYEDYGLKLSYNNGWWNPLQDDGDALRLAVKLHIDLCINNGASEAVWIDLIKSETKSIEIPCDEYFEGIENKYTAIRLAIVRAAAEIGMGMK